MTSINERGQQHGEKVAIAALRRGPRFHGVVCVLVGLVAAGAAVGLRSIGIRMNVLPPISGAAVALGSW